MNTRRHTTDNLDAVIGLLIGLSIAAVLWTAFFLALYLY